MNIDEAWEAFRKGEPIQKTSVGEKLDTIAAALNEIQVDAHRTAEIVPKILGDDAALQNVSTEQPMPMDGQLDAMPEGMPAEVPGAEAMGEPPIESAEAPVEPGVDVTAAGDDMMADNGMDETPIPEDSEVAPMLDAGPDMGAEDISVDAPVEDIGMEGDTMDDLGLEEDLGAGDADMGTDNMAPIKEIISEEINDGNFERARKLLSVLESMSGGIAADVVEPMTEPEMAEDEPAPEADAEPAEEPESTDDAPAESDDKKDDKKDDKESESVAKSDMNPAEPAAGNGEQPSTQIAESDCGDCPSAAEKIAVEVATAVEGIVENVLNEDEAPKDEEQVVIVSEPESHEEHGEDDKKEEISEHPFEECDDMKKSADAEDMFSFKNIYNASMSGVDLIGDALRKSADESDDPFARIDPTHSMQETFRKSMDQLSQIHPANELITGNAPAGKTQLDEVDEKKTISGGPESVRGSVDAPKQSGADKLDEVDEKKSPSENPPTGGSQLDEVGDSKQAHAKEGKDQLDEVDEKKTGNGSTEKPKDQLDEVDAAKVKKSEEDGKHIMTFREMMSIMKSGSRPDADTSMNGEIVRPEPGSFHKSGEDSAPVRMGRGIDPMKVVEQDLADYKAYMAQKRL